MARKLSMLFILVSLSIMLSQSALAATIYGNTYDMELNQVNNVIVEISSRPEQLYVAKNGSYQFFVPQGDYMLKASYYDEMYTEENISVASDGNYALDLILMPNITETPPLENELITETFDDNQNYFVEGGIMLLAIAAIAIIIKFGWVFSMKKQKKRLTEKEIEEIAEDDSEEIPGEPDFSDKVIGIIRKNGGRTTQKEIRKELPYSEAKISLVIAELEHKGIVQKIKKGRGNIIILKKP